ncbi:hypothetical protein LCGC14_2946200, partial [marine sediment metagenome]
EITGKYPFQDQTELPHYVHIATKEQEQYAKGGPPYSHKKSSAQSLANELISKLGPEIEVPFDLQRVPTNKPNFYIYMINEDLYFFAIHVSQYYGFATKINENYYKVEISNNPTKENKAVAFSDLIKNKRFIDVLNSKSSKPGFFEKREKDYLNYTKTK